MHCAGLLAASGRRVCVLEQHDVIGGASHQYDLTADDKSRYTFDSGLHYAIPLCENFTHLALGGKAPPVHWPKLGHEGKGAYEVIVYSDDEPPFPILHKEAHLEQMRAIVGDRALKDYAYSMKGFPLYALSRVFPFPFQSWFRSLFGQFKSYGGKTQSEAMEYVTDPKARMLLQGLWLNSGALPSKVSNLLATSVLRGFPQMGGAYPEGGAAQTARAATSFLRQQGSDVFVRVAVTGIEIDAAGRAAGVKLENGRVIKAREGVVSTCGYHNTRNLLPATLSASWPESFEGVGPSDGFITVNIGFKKTFEFTDPRRGRQNLWYSAVDADEAVAAGLDSFLNRKSELPFGILWSTKDPSHTGLVSLQVLYCVPYDWFSTWAEQPSGNRDADYQELKRRFGIRAVENLIRFFPEAKDQVALVDVSTPLTIEHYLKAPKGSAVGLEHSPASYCSLVYAQNTDTQTSVPGLWISGQDFVALGVPNCQASGIITALRMFTWRQRLAFVVRTLRMIYNAI